MDTFTLALIETDDDYRAAFGVMRELRPKLSDADAFATQARRQGGQGYRLLAAWQDGEVKALAGYRILENLMNGRFLYVDDLVTTASSRRHGLGARLIAALRDESRRQGCDNFVLDTGLHMPLAQRFYYRQGLLAMGMQFVQPR